MVRPFFPLARCPQVRDLLVSEREKLFTALQAIPFLEPYPSHANFILAKVGGWATPCCPGACCGSCPHAASYAGVGRRSACVGHQLASDAAACRQASNITCSWAPLLRRLSGGTPRR